MEIFKITRKTPQNLEQHAESTQNLARILDASREKSPRNLGNGFLEAPRGKHSETWPGVRKTSRGEREEGTRAVDPRRGRLAAASQPYRPAPPQTPPTPLPGRRIGRNFRS